MVELIFSFLLIIFCMVSGISLLLSSSDMMSYDPMGPVVWPMILCVLLVVLLSANVWKILRKTRGTRERLTEKEDVKERLSGKLPMSLGIMLLYGILLEKIGFLFSTPLFIFTYMTVLGQKRAMVKWITAAVATIVLYLLFHGLLQVPLPRGYGVFRSVALMLETIL